MSRETRNWRYSQILIWISGLNWAQALIGLLFTSWFLDQSGLPLDWSGPWRCLSLFTLGGGVGLLASAIDPRTHWPAVFSGVLTRAALLACWSWWIWSGATDHWLALVSWWIELGQIVGLWRVLQRN